MTDHKHNKNPWSNLQTILRYGTLAMDGVKPDSDNLLFILDENNRLFNAMVDAFDGMIYICSLDFTIEFLNDRMIQHLGYDATGELCYKAFGRSSVCPWCINTRIMKGETIRWEAISPRDGRWYYVVNAPIQHIDGTISKYAMMMDIHDRKQNEQELKKHRTQLEELVKARTAELVDSNAQLLQEIEERKTVETTLRESQHRYRTLFEGSRDAIFISDMQGAILDVNNAASLLTGFEKSELTQKAVPELNRTADPGIYDHYFQRVRSGESFSVEGVLQHRNGNKIFAEFSSQQISLAGKWCIHTTARDISARKTAEAALRKSEAKYRELVQNANSLIIRFDTRGRLTFFNEYAQQFFGYTEKEILGRNILDTILPPVNSFGNDIQWQFEDFLLHPEKYKTNELESERHNGERIWVAWTNRPIRDADGRIVEFLCVGLDITERKAARREIRNLTHALFKTQETERAKIARDLHDHIAQDLSSLKIRIQTLLHEFPALSEISGTQAADLLNILQRSISEVRNIAYDLRPPGLDQLGLVNTLFIYCEDFAKLNNLKIDFVSAGLEGMSLDADTQINIYRLIQEALHNVKKHARARGVTIRLVASSPNLLLRIIDDGCGFDVKNWRDRSYREKRMGLNSMTERVELLGGIIEIRSHPQKGTAILITIPIKEHQRGSQDTNSDH
jgi:PAS domain S-box-containing protein